jgi:hypothetical protein
MPLKDRDILNTALKSAALIVGDYLEPGSPKDAVVTIKRLIEVLEDPKLSAAIERVERGHGLRVVK